VPTSSATNNIVADRPDDAAPPSAITSVVLDPNRSIIPANSAVERRRGAGEADHLRDAHSRHPGSSGVTTIRRRSRPVAVATRSLSSAGAVSTVCRTSASDGLAALPSASIR
jgi:hypothetical protein